MQATPENLTVQSLSMSWFPEPKLCVEVSRTISCQYLSTTHTGSPSFTISKGNFYVAVTKSPHRQGPWLPLPPVLQCNQLLRLLLQVGSPLASKELSKHFSHLILGDSVVHLIPQFCFLSKYCFHCPTTSPVEADSSPFLRHKTVCQNSLLT